MFRKNILTLALVAGLTLLPANAQARTFKWVTNLHIVSVEPTTGGWVWVRFDVTSFDCSNEGGPSNASALVLNLTDLPLGDGAFDRIFSSLLSAQFANRAVDFQITGSNNGAACLIERARIK